MSNKRKLGRGCAVVGAGMSKFGGYPKGVRTTDLFVEAYTKLAESIDKGLDPNRIGALYFSNFCSDRFESFAHTAPYIANQIGLLPVPAIRFEDACASGAVAFKQAVLAIASGMYDAILVGGAEKMTNLDTPQVTEILASAGDPDTELPAGETFPGLYATIASAHMAKYGTTQEDFMRVGIKNQHNGSLNENAHFDMDLKTIMQKRAQSAVKKGKPEPSWSDEMEFLQDSKQNPAIAWPLRLYDCSTICDGAAAVLLVSEDLAQEFTDDPIYVIGTGQASDRWLAERDDLTSIKATQIASSQVYEMSRVTPKDIKLAEVHDCFTIAEILAMEDLGFYESGEAVKAIRNEETSLAGKLPINMDGGLKAKGHPIGASGIGMIVEMFKQMREQAGQRQVSKKNPDLGLTHNVGAHGTTVVVNVFERR